MIHLEVKVVHGGVLYVCISKYWYTCYSKSAAYLLCINHTIAIVDCVCYMCYLH